MPNYEYRCADCGYEFSVKMKMAEHGRVPVLCPLCESTRVVQRISAVHVRTNRKS